jgi:protocatechuate 3,4-dioxygenase beta subunit
MNLQTRYDMNKGNSNFGVALILYPKAKLIITSNKNRLIKILRPFILLTAMGCSLSKTSLTKNDGTGPYYPPDPTGLPFYGSFPISNPEKATNDLTIHPLTGRNAQGERTLIKGIVIGLDGIPIPDVDIELWNTNVFGSYPTEKNPKGIDPDFFGYGKTKSNEKGVFQFITIRPIAYTRYGFLIRRTAHFHMKFSSEKVTCIGIEADIINDSSQYVSGKNQILLYRPLSKEFQWQGELQIILAKNNNVPPFKKSITQINIK